MSCGDLFSTGCFGAQGVGSPLESEFWEGKLENWAKQVPVELVGPRKGDRADSMRFVNLALAPRRQSILRKPYNSWSFVSEFPFL
jgi:hypothetical protein